eukprot:s2184_g3.t1
MYTLSAAIAWCAQMQDTPQTKGCRWRDRIGPHSGCASQGCTPQVPLEPTHLQTTPTTTVAASPPLSYTTGATGSWVAPAQAVTKGSDVPVSIKQVRPRQGSHVPPRVVAKPQIASPPTHFRTVVQRSVSVPVLQPVEGLTVAHPSMPVPAQMHVQLPLGTQANSGSLRLQPAVVRTASPPQGSMPMAQSRHKPADRLGGEMGTLPTCAIARSRSLLVHRGRQPLCLPAGPWPNDRSGCEG